MSKYSEATNMSYDEPPSRLDLAIALFTRNGTSDFIGSVHARSVRIPTIENMTIEALAQHSNISVNKVIVQLLGVALESVFQGMSEDQREQVFSKRSELLQALTGQDGACEFPGAEPAREGEA